MNIDFKITYRFSEIGNYNAVEKQLLSEGWIRQDYHISNDHSKPDDELYSYFGREFQASLKKAENTNRLPIGLPPIYIWKANRLKDLSEAINRYYIRHLEVPVEWVEEYNHLIKES